MRALIFFVVALLVLPQSALAVISFTQLDQDIFIVSHRVKFIGSRGKAQKMVYTKAASLCEAAGFSYFKILDQESNASQQYESANASARIQLYQAKGEGRIGCEKNSDVKYVEQAREKLAKIGYQPPEENLEPPAETEAGSTSCTVEQITAMVRAGLSDEQVKAACPEG